MYKCTTFMSSMCLVISLLVLTGCAANKNRSQPLSEKIVTIPMIFKYEDLQVAAPYIVGDTEGFEIGILHGGGKIVTNDDTQSLLIGPTKNNKFVLDFDEIYHVSEHEMRNLDVSSNPSVVVVPPTTKLQRISIYTYDKFLYDNNFRRDVGYTVLNDELSGDDLIILAVDRACTISGRITRSEDMEDIDVEIKSAGLHFLKMLRLPGKRAKLVIAEQDIRPRLIVSFYKSYVKWLQSNPPSLKGNRKLPVIPANS